MMDDSRSDTALPKAILTRVSTLRPLSQSALRLLEVVGHDTYSLDDVTRIVEHDAALTANVLRVANSSAFGLLHKVDSLARACSYLGDKMVVGIAITSSSPDVYDKVLTGYDGDHGGLWLHCLRAAIAAREVARHSRQAVNAELAFTAGLLHDIGKAVLSEFMGDGKDLGRPIQENDGDFLGVERALTGTDHAEVGLFLARRWNLPEPLCQAIALHHRPEQARPADKLLVCAVHLGDAIAMLGGTGTGADSMGYRLSSEAQACHDLNEGALERIILDVDVEFTTASGLMAKMSN